MKKNAETPGAAKDPPWKQTNMFNWDTRFDMIYMPDKGYDVTYLEEDEAWLQWDLAVKLLDSKRYT